MVGLSVIQCEGMDVMDADVDINTCLYGPFYFCCDFAF